MTNDRLQRTGRECNACGSGEFLRSGYELFCETCGYAPERETTVIKNEDPWRAFWKTRQEYSGFRGPDRVKMVGGFASAY